MANILFAWANRIDEATLSGGSWQAGLPLSNLKNRTLSLLARSADATTASTKFDADLGQARWIGAVALIAHNASVGGKARIRGADSQANLTSAPLYDSGWLDAWPSGTIPLSLLEWEDDNFWLGTLSAEARAGYRAPFVKTFPRVNRRWWRVEIDDTGNADGYVHLGRVLLAETWQPGLNYSYGVGAGFDDVSTFETSLGGVEYFDARPKKKTLRLSLDWIDGTEAFTKYNELQRIVGTTGELLVLPDPDDTAGMPRRAVYGRLLSLAPLEQHLPTYYRSQLEIRELL